ncbi:MAG: hypothetical protein OWQ54_02365 [Sulfolobaceae archaeon]|nr:hypothetical protein [Sulfolobaceae archaeon]
MLDEIVDKELKSSDAVDIKLEDIIKIAEVLRKIRSKYNDELHQEEIKIYEQLAESLFELRLSKYLENGKISGFDSFLFSLIETIKRFYVEFVTGKYQFYGNKVLCRVLNPFLYQNVRLNKGDLIALSLDKALILTTAGYITPNL